MAKRKKTKSQSARQKSAVAKPPEHAPRAAKAAVEPRRPLSAAQIEWLFVGVFWLISTIVIWRLAVGHVSPRRFQDESLWSSVAESLAKGDWLLWRSEPSGVKSPLYPLSIAPAYLFSDATKTAYHTIHMLNAAMMCAVVFPVYYVTRKYGTQLQAAVSSLLALSIPAMNYAGIVGTESLAYPIATFAGLAIAMVAASPGRRSWIIAGVALTLAVLTRTQFVVLIPCLPLAVLLAGLMRAPEERRDYFRAQATGLKIAGVIAVSGMLVTLIAPSLIVGVYREAVDAGAPGVGDLWFWLRGFVAGAFIVCGIIPAIAAIAMALGRGNRRDPAIGGLLATTFVISLALVFETSWFSANSEFSWENGFIFYERYIIYIAPLFFVLFALSWQRMSTRNVFVATAVVAVGLSGFDEKFVLWGLSYDSFGLTLIGSLVHSSPGLGDQIGIYLAILGVALGAILAATTVENRRVAQTAAASALAITFFGLIWGQAKSWHIVRRDSPAVHKSVPKPVDWIDRNGGGDVGLVVTSGDSPHDYFTTEFWNKSVSRIFTVDKEPFKSPFVSSAHCDIDWESDGTLVSKTCQPLPDSFYYRDREIGAHLKNPVEEFADNAGRRLLIGTAPVQIASILSGRNIASGEVKGELDLRTFFDEPVAVQMKVTAKSIDGYAVIGARRIELPTGRAVTVGFEVPPGERITALRFVDESGRPMTVVVPEVVGTDRNEAVFDLR